MSISLLDSENADLNLTSAVTCLTHTPDASNPRQVQPVINLGDGSKNLNGTGATTITLGYTLGSQTGPNETFSLASGVVRGVVRGGVILVPANVALALKLTSSNGSDSDVDVTAYLMDVGGSAAGVVAAFADLYHADIDYRRDSAAGEDIYGVRWYKNGVRVTSGITTPTLTVKNQESGSTLINGDAMTDAGSGQLYLTVNTASGKRQTQGQEYEVLVSATIDSAARTFSKCVGRDL